MDNYLSNKAKMYGASSKYLHDNSTLVNSIPGFAESLAEFDENLALIETQEVNRTKTSQGKTEVKHSSEYDMIVEAINVASSLRAYASKNKLAELKMTSKISLRKLARMKEIDQVTKCSQIYDEAKKLENALAGEGLTPADVALLKTKIDEYKSAGKTRDSSVASRKGIRINIIDLFDEQDELLEEQLDSFVNKFIKTDKQFYDGYYAARLVKEYGVRHNKKPGAENEGNSPAPSA